MSSALLWQLSRDGGNVDFVKRRGVVFNKNSVDGKFHRVSHFGSAEKSINVVAKGKKLYLITKNEKFAGVSPKRSLKTYKLSQNVKHAAATIADKVTYYRPELAKFAIAKHAALVKIARKN